MPPTGEPVEEMILRDIDTTLRTIQGGTDYYTTIPTGGVIRADTGMVEPRTTPAVLFQPRTFQSDLAGKSVTEKTSTHLFVDVQLVIETRTNIQLTLQRFVRDVRKALCGTEASWTRGGYAIWTRINSGDYTYPSDANDSRCGADLEVEILYRTRDDDPNTQG